jgi:hypothetical protein
MIIMCMLQREIDRKFYLEGCTEKPSSRSGGSVVDSPKYQGQAVSVHCKKMRTKFIVVFGGLVVVAGILL